MNDQQPQQPQQQNTPPMSWEQESKFDPLALALHELDVIIEAQNRHIATWGYWYQRDEIVTPNDRRAEEKIRNEAKQLTRKRISATENLILEARHLIDSERRKGEQK